MDGLSFRSQDQKHELSHIYEAKLRNMGNAGRNGGEYYTPRPLKRRDNVDTYAYFGDPVYIYSLKEGINDGYLTPFKVKQIATTLDDYIYTPDDKVIEGEIEQGTVSRILAACDKSLGTLYYWLGGGPRDEQSAPLLPPLARRRVVVGKRRKPLAASRVSLLARLYRTAERQAFEIEQRLAVPGEVTPERERDVRMLASLTRTLRDLSGLGDGEPAAESAGDAGALAQAHRQMDNKEALREADERMGLVRALVDYTRSMRKYEATLSERAEQKAQAQEAKTKKAAETDQMRRDLARRITGMIEAGRAEREGGAGA